MAEVQHSQIKSKLLELIAPLLDKSDIPAKSGAERDAHILSRSMAAAAIKILAEVDDVAAANAIVDGGKDNGIDAIYYDPQGKTLFLVQSKWSNSHSSSILKSDEFSSVFLTSWPSGDGRQPTSL